MEIHWGTEGREAGKGKAEKRRAASKPRLSLCRRACQMILVPKVTLQTGN